MKKIFLFSTSLMMLLAACAPGGDHTHDLKFYMSKDATCTEDGYEAYFQCVTCNKYYSDDLAENEIASPAVIPATGHGENLHHFDAIPGTCLEKGYAEYYEC